MSTPRSEQVEQLYAQYRRQFDQVRETQRQLGEISCTVSAPRNTVSVTVGHGGVVKDISFPTGAYKNMAPRELAAALLDTLRKAQDQATHAAAELLAPSLPEGVDAHKLFSGKLDLQELMSAEPRTGADSGDRAKSGE
ncbi:MULTISPECIES: YbaB/EbfC family nucleoid-associated protein [unclassified Crossiella]|uniref:YbaB/EbfC family nucleoid-associated protein n=1 Tax=unclassified Crossiella TaxID=2620835 RepID=UPI00200009DB|nr:MULTISPECIES: YbaB/EbfC family nucleoid-associated protein [unclassified Crossiella]MCK2244234.1 YbaB/EbfC family nucleoid-associated protein [Crossiella sp. S99.2]MCK2258038.1 YbaB/EbfC family nucleoid-associated protein [Crossiella sp. S99.1]